MTVETLKKGTLKIVSTTKIVGQYGPTSNLGPLPQNIANTFRSGTYVEVITTKPTVLYRVYDVSAKQLGAYWTDLKPSGPVQSIIDTALNPASGNNATKVVKIEVPVGVKLYQGYASAQGGLTGGGTQVLFPKDIKIDNAWIKND